MFVTALTAMAVGSLPTLMVAVVSDGENAPTYLSVAVDSSGLTRRRQNLQGDVRLFCAVVNWRPMSLCRRFRVAGK